MRNMYVIDVRRGIITAALSGPLGDFSLDRGSLQVSGVALIAGPRCSTCQPDTSTGDVL